MLQFFRLFATLGTVALQASLFMEFFRKNTGVGSPSLLQGIFPTQGSNPCFPHCMQIHTRVQTHKHRHAHTHIRCVWAQETHRSVVCSSLLHSPWDSLGQNTGVGHRSLLQGIFPAQGSNRGLLHCRWILYQLSHQGSPRILEWVAIPFSRGSSQPRARTGLSCIAGGFFTS